MKIPRSPVRCTTPGQDRAGPRVEARTARATGQQGNRAAERFGAFPVAFIIYPDLAVILAAVVISPSRR